MKLAFMHIPKTGGISVERAVAASVPDLNTCPAYYTKEYAGKTFADMPDYDFYKGHFDFDFMASIPDDYVKVVVVRRPVDLLLSLYNHIGSRQKHRLHEAVNAPDATFAKVLADNHGLTNTLSKYLLGSTRYKEMMATEGKRAERAEAAVAQVRQHLATFHVIGLTNKLPDFVTRVADKVGRPLNRPRKENKNPGTLLSKDKMSKEDVAAAQRATWLDRPVHRMIIETAFKAEPVA
ncbi:MAG: hypothetical protein AAGE18_02110 [Pseudomonadota bacterium]